MLSSTSKDKVTVHWQRSGLIPGTNSLKEFKHGGRIIRRVSRSFVTFIMRRLTSEMSTLSTADRNLKFHWSINASTNKNKVLGLSLQDGLKMGVELWVLLRHIFSLHLSCAALSAFGRFLATGRWRTLERCLSHMLRLIALWSYTEGLNVMIRFYNVYFA